MYLEFRVSLKELFDSYSGILGREFSKDLSKALHEASEMLEEKSLVFSFHLHIPN